MSNTMEEWWVDFKLTDGSKGNYSLVMVEIQFSRGSNQKFFSIFIVILMWTMSLAVLSLAIVMCWYQRSIDSPTIVI